MPCEVDVEVVQKAEVARFNRVRVVGGNAERHERRGEWDSELLPERELLVWRELGRRERAELAHRKRAVLGEAPAIVHGGDHQPLVAVYLEQQRDEPLQAASLGRCSVRGTAARESR
jgi:hypothetical protein